jgi:steroid delta-isomerase-like uncharacterized protein
MTVQENIALAQKFFDALNAHDPNRTIPLEAPNYKFKAPGSEEAMDGNQSRAYAQGFITAFPDLSFEVTNKIAQEDFVVFNWISRGTHKGVMKTPSGASLPATNKKMSLHGSTTYEFKDGKAIRAWVFFDMVSLLTQLGLMPVI